MSTDTLPGICGLLILQRTFTATDDAGNVNEVIQTMTQVDTQGPTFVAGGGSGFVVHSKFQPNPCAKRKTRARK